MDDIEREIASIETQLARLDPQLAPLLAPPLVETLRRLVEARGREAGTHNEGRPRAC